MNPQPSGNQPGGYSGGSNYNSPNSSAQGGATPGTRQDASAVSTSQTDYKAQIITGRAGPYSSRAPYMGPPDQAPWLDKKESLGQLLLDVMHMGKADVLKLQDRLVNAGLLTAGKYQRGYADDSTLAAYKSLLLDAFASDASIDEQFDKRSHAAKEFGIAGGSGAAKQGEIVELTNPDDIKAVADKVIPAKIGRKLSDAELQRFIAGFHAGEKAYYDQRYAAEGAGLPGGPGGTVRAAPNLSDYLDQEAEREFPQEAARQGTLNNLDVVTKLIQGGVNA